MLCSSSPGKQHPGTIPHPVTSGHRHLHQLVARETCAKSIRLTFTLVPGSEPPTSTETISSQVASPCSLVPSTTPHTPSFKMVFIKHAAVLDQLCNHKQAAIDWSTGHSANCCCKNWTSFKTAALNPSEQRWVLAGSLLHSLLPDDLAVIAEGPLLNKVFPSKKEYHTQLKTSQHSWTKRNSLPSMPNADISDFSHHLWMEHFLPKNFRRCNLSL